LSASKGLVLFGPTASGKTALLERVFAEYKKPVEIISADSMQVYRGMDIGTAKPSLKERAKIPHHLIDIRDPGEQFNAGEFVRLAEEACMEAAGRGALPVVSGGTGFYLKNLVQGLSDAPPSDKELRSRLKEELELNGAGVLMEELAKADPVSAGRIHINDEYRLLRALEVYRLTGRPLSSFNSPWTLTRESREDLTPGHEGAKFILIGLRRSREELYRRINERVAAMFRAGLAEEVRRLYEAGYTPADPGLRAIGYREFFVEEIASIAGESEGESKSSWRVSQDLAGVEALIAQNSRRYAKRQITFFSSLPDVKWIDLAFDEGGGGEDDAAREIQVLLAEFLAK
jgi:tRNA dimethylallyltransferase